MFRAFIAYAHIKFRHERVRRTHAQARPHSATYRNAICDQHTLLTSLPVADHHRLRFAMAAQKDCERKIGQMHAEPEHDSPPE